MKRLGTILLTLLLLVMVAGLGFAIPNGALNEDAADRYMEEQNNSGDDSWLLDF